MGALCQTKKNFTYAKTNSPNIAGLASQRNLFTAIAIAVALAVAVALAIAVAVALAIAADADIIAPQGLYTH